MAFPSFFVKSEMNFLIVSLFSFVVGINGLAIRAVKPKVGEKLKLIIDSDGVTDDLRAISMALTNPNVEVLAITTVHGCVPVDQAVANIARLQRAIGLKKKVPIYRGAEFALLKNKLVDESFLFGKDGLSDNPEADPRSETNDSIPSSDELAAEAIVRLTREHQDVVLVTLGPVTNVAIALKIDPHLGKRIQRLVMMGGNYLGIGNVKITSTAESNFNGDPEAVEVILRELHAPIKLVPWESYYVNQDLYDHRINFTEHMHTNTRLSRFIRAVTERIRKVSADANQQYKYCDEIAMSIAIDPSRIKATGRFMHVSMELAGHYTRGQLALNWMSRKWNDEEKLLNQGDNRHPIEIVTGFDVEALNNWMTEVTSGEYRK